MSKNLVVITRWAYAKAVMGGASMSLVEFRQMEREAFFIQRMKLGAALRHLKVALKNCVKRDLSRWVNAS
ncbi:hypothetical protein ACGRSR_17885 [Vibrio owensii]|uniref:hypothetical protein n=1 Tax=Vibrio owensii TaxID=696485 RepID=UPI0031CC53CC